MNEKEDHSRFTIHDDPAAPDSIYIADAENLRIEKLSTRVTLVAVLIPCLLVVVLAVAYLDIKNRVISTQNTGSIGVQNLSKDLESRFSNLSLKQAKIDQQLAETVNTMQTATAALQVNLKKTNAELKRIADTKPDRSALAAVANKTDGTMADLRKEIVVLRKDIADVNAAFEKFDEELAGQILLMAEGLKKDQGRLAAIEQKAHQLETQQLSKDSMELTLRLERLALQEMVKDKVRELEKKLVTLSKQIDGLSQRMDSQARNASPPPTPASTPSPKTLPPAAPDSPSNSAGMEEQTIN